MLKHTLTIFVLFSVFGFLRGQCQEEFNLSYDRADDFTCSLDLNFDLTTQNDYTSVTAVARVCDSLYKSETVENIIAGENISLKITTGLDCVCNSYEPFLIFTYQDSEGETASNQCFESPFNFEFENCPIIEIVDQSFLVLNDQACEYVQQISINTNVDLDALELTIRDCESFNSVILIEDIEANQDKVVQFEIANTCGCDQLMVTPKMIQDQTSVICNNIQFPIERINFLPFPLELEKFELVERGTKLFAEWKTLFEIALSEFTIEYSIDGMTFTEVTTIEANLSENEYSVEVPNVEGYYRLRVINQNSEYGFTDILFNQSSFEFSFYDSVILFSEPRNVQTINAQGQLLLNQTGLQVDLNALPNNSIYFIYIDSKFVQKYFKPN